VIEVNNKIQEIYEVIVKSGLDEDQSLLGGSCGVSMFLFYYARFVDDQKPYDIAFETMSSTLEKINPISDLHTFASGLAGIGYSIENLSRNDFIDVDTKDILGPIDELLFERMKIDLNNGNYDFLHGALGIGLYFISRNAFEKRDEYLGYIVDELYILGEKDSNGIKWRSILDNNTEKYGYNISLSHGMSSIIAFLSKIIKEEINKTKATFLLEGAVNYLLNQKLPANEYLSIFPSWALESTETIAPSRMAWCYGDLGISVSLWHASQALNRKDWKEEAIHTILHSAKRQDLSYNFVVDAGLCHGTAGMALIFMRMYQYTGIEELKDTSDYWYQQTLKMATFDDGLAGYKAYRAKISGGWANEIGLLEGIAGIGLALISAVSDIEPAWDECLLLS